jgi:hypothetical protein
MKRVLLLSVLFVIAASMAFGQIAYKQGDMVITGALGLGGVAGVYGESTLPPISGAVDYGYNENISVGGLVGISGSENLVYKGTSNEYGWKYTYIVIGVRGAYHYDLLHKDNIDTYGGIMIGYNIVSFSEVGTIGYGGTAGASFLAYGGYIGGRYYFTPNLAAQLELGYGMGFLSLGVAYKL